MGLGRRARITVHGRLSAHLAPAFPGMTFVRRGSRTDLVGEIVDQAHLYGLLARIRDLGLVLEGLRLASDESAPRPEPERHAHEEA